MFFLNSLIVVVFVVNALLGLSILLRHKDSRENKYFVHFVGFVDLWILSNYLENAPQLVGQDLVGLFLRLDFAAAILALYFWFRFCFLFSGENIVFLRSKIVRSISIGIVMALAALSLFTDLVLRNTSFSKGLARFDPDIFWPAYAAVLVILSFGGLLLLLLGRRRAVKAKEFLKVQQLNLILLGFLFSVGNAIFINLVLQTFFPISLEVSRVGIYGLTLLVALTAYAIAKHKLFELKFLIWRAVTYLIFILFFAILFGFVMLSVIESLTHIEINHFYFYALPLLIAIATLTFKPIEHFLAWITNRVFYKERYDPEELLSSLTRIMANTIDLALLADSILTRLLAEMKVSKGAFLMVDKHRVIQMRQVGYGASIEDPRFEVLLHQTGSSEYFVPEEMADPGLKKLFEEFDVEVAIPIKVKNEEVAILILGPKNSGEAYYQDDLDTLKIFASESGIAIQNAKNYEEIKRFTKRLEEKVEERTKQLKLAQEQELLKTKEVARLKDEFVFLAAHELKSPINSIKGFLGLTLDSKTRFSKDVRSNLDSISQASGQLSQLINDLLEVARSDSGTLKVELKEADLVPVLNSVIQTCEPMLKEKKIKITVSTDERVMVLCDTDKLKEVLMNLITNAIKYNKEKGSIAITSYCYPGKNFAITEIKDTGYGIPADRQDKIFQKFFRASTKGTEEVIGTGLGLFITKMLVEKMSGTIRFSSKEGEGSLFTFSLPISPAPKTAEREVVSSAIQ